LPQPANANSSTVAGFRLATVSDITPNQRHAIEELVGGDLAPDQRIFVLAYRPGVEPNEADKSVARSRIEELLTKAHENAKQQDLAPAEIEAANRP
jgi:LDH2 family malate/lactate/ureidoglycolate dehydrogenase